MRRVITLKYAGTCADCGAALAVGSLARYYGRGRVYGTECHSVDTGIHGRQDVCSTCGGHGERNGAECRACDSTGSRDVQEYARSRERTAYEMGDTSEGAIRSHYDRRGAYTADGTFLGTTGPRCEDAPCCGCCS